MPRTKRTRKYSKKYTSTIPYVKGFRPPTKIQQLKAIGGGKQSPIPPEYVPDAKFFRAIPRCTSIDDWLAQYCEEGQSYSDFQVQCPWLSGRKVKYVKHTFNPIGSNLAEKYPNGVIYILQLGEFDRRAPHFDALIEYAQLFYCLRVKKLPKVKLETKGEKLYWIHEEELDDGSIATIETLVRSRHDASSGNCQLRVHSGLTQLRDYMPDDGICLIALTMYDLYEDNTDLFVAGMAAGNQRVAMFSLRRYDPNLEFSKEFWHEIKEINKCNCDEQQYLLLQRSCRLLVHELGHLLGLAHCIYFDCCMNGAGHLQEDFRQSMLLCPVDLRKLQLLCGFDVVQRYEGLKAFYTKWGFSKEALWIEQRLALIQEQRSVKITK